MDRLSQIERLWGNPKLTPEPLLSDVRWLTESVRSLRVQEGLLRKAVELLEDEKEWLSQQLAQAGAANAGQQRPMNRSHDRGAEAGKPAPQAARPAALQTLQANIATPSQLPPRESGLEPRKPKPARKR